jgi:hypothetical protein
MTDSTPTGHLSLHSTGAVHDPNQTLMVSGISDTPLAILPQPLGTSADVKSVGKRNPVYLAQVSDEAGGANPVEGLVRLLQFLGQGAVDLTGIGIGALGRWVSPPVTTHDQEQNAIRQAPQPVKPQSQNLAPPAPRTASPQSNTAPKVPPEPEKTPGGGPQKPDPGQSAAAIVASQAQRDAIRRQIDATRAETEAIKKQTEAINAQTQRSQAQHGREQQGRADIARELLSRYPASTRQQIINSAIADYRKSHPNETINPKNPQPKDAGTWQTVVSIAAGYYPQPSTIDKPTQPKVAPLSEPANAPFAVPTPTVSPQPNQGPNLTKIPKNPLDRLDSKTSNSQQPAKVTAQEQQPSNSNLPDGSASRDSKRPEDNRREDKQKPKEPKQQKPEPEELKFQSTGQPITGQTYEELAPQERRELQRMGYTVSRSDDGESWELRRFGGARKPAIKLRFDEQGRLQLPDKKQTNRISDEKRTNRNFDQQYGENIESYKFPKGYTRQHIVGDNVWQTEELPKEALRREREGDKAALNLDAAENLIAMPGSKEALERTDDVISGLEAKGALSKIVQLGEHPKYDNHAKEVLKEKQEELLRKYPSKALKDIPTEEINHAIREAQQQLRQETIDADEKLKNDDLKNLPDWVKPRYKPPNQDHTFPKVSTTQPDEIEA